MPGTPPARGDAVAAGAALACGAGGVWTLLAAPLTTWTVLPSTTPADPQPRCRDWPVPHMPSATWGADRQPNGRCCRIPYDTSLRSS